VVTFLLLTSHLHNLQAPLLDPCLRFGVVLYMACGDADLAQVAVIFVRVPLRACFNKRVLPHRELNKCVVPHRELNMNLSYQLCRGCSPTCTGAPHLIQNACLYAYKKQWLLNLRERARQNNA